MRIYSAHCSAPRNGVSVCIQNTRHTLAQTCVVSVVCRVFSIQAKILHNIKKRSSAQGCVVPSSVFDALRSTLDLKIVTKVL